MMCTHIKLTDTHLAACSHNFLRTQGKNCILGHLQTLIEGDFHGGNRFRAWENQLQKNLSQQFSRKYSKPTTT